MVALWNLWHLRTATQAPAEQRDPVINAYIFERDRSALAAQVIDFTWTNPDIQVSDLPTMELTTDDVDTRPGVIGDISVPHPYTASSLELRHIAQQAGLAGGQVATVILSVDVQADGSVDDIRVLVSCGQLDIDDAAIRYARSLRWIPGTVRREAMAMRIRFPVTLVGAPVLIPVSGTQGAGHGSDRKPARKASAMFGGS